MKGSSNVKSYILEKIEAELLGQVMCKVLHIKEIMARGDAHIHGIISDFW